MARGGAGLALLASVLVGGAVGITACNEKKTSETAASADANAKEDAGVAPAASAGGTGDASDAADGDAADGGAADGGDADAAAPTDASSASALDPGRGEGGARRDGGAGGGSLETAGSADAGSKALPLPVSLDETSAGKTIELAVGQTVTLSLGANPTSGFDWSVTRAPAALGAPAMSYVQGGAQMGAPGTRKITWTVKSALPPGDHAVELGYARSFEKGVAPFKTFKMKVRAAR